MGEYRISEDPLGKVEVGKEVPLKYWCCKGGEVALSNGMWEGGGGLYLDGVGSMGRRGGLYLSNRRLAGGTRGYTGLAWRNCGFPGRAGS